MFYPENTVKKVGTCKHQVNKYVLISLWKLLFSEKIFTNAWKEKCCTVVLTIVHNTHLPTYYTYIDIEVWKRFCAIFTIFLRKRGTSGGNGKCFNSPFCVQ